jgi:hypothetical protein
MSMPQIPEGKFRPNQCEVIIDLLESIALEEIALSHLIKAESEKIQAFVGKHHNFPSCPNTQEIIKFNQGVHRLIDVVVMKEWLLLRKLENVMDLRHEFECKEHDHHDHKHDDDKGDDWFEGEE